MKVFVLSVFFFIMSLFCQIQANPVITFGGSGIDEIRDMLLSHDGNIVVTGVFSQQADFDPSSQTKNLTSMGSNDIFIAKYDSAGKLFWVKGIGGTGDDQVTSMFIDAIGDIFITGSFTGSCDFDPSGLNQVKVSKGQSDAFIAKYKQNGDLIWVVAFGGPLNDVANDAFVDIIGSVSVVGTFSGTIDVEPSDMPDAGDTYTSNGMSDIFLVVYSDSGAYETGFSWGGPGDDEGTSVAVDEELNFIIAGNFSQSCDFDTGISEYLLNSSGSTDGFIAKYDLIGNIWWAIKLGGTGTDKINRNSLATDLLNNIYVAGMFSNSVNFNPDGSAISTSNGKFDAFLAKYDENGLYLWSDAFGSSNDDKIVSISLDNNDNIYASGSFLGTVDFDPSAAVKQLSSVSAGGSDGFSARYDRDGKFNWVYGVGNTDQMPNPGNFVAKTVSDEKGNVYSSGSYFAAASFYNDVQQLKVNGFGSSDCFIAMLDNYGKFKNDVVQKNITVSYPNGGEVWETGTEVSIAWTASNIDTFNISLSTDGSTFANIFTNVTLSQSPLKFTVPYTPSAKCLIVVSAVNDRTVSDSSDSFFEIIDKGTPIVNIIKPNGGETITANTGYDISWQSWNITNIDIFFSSDNGLTWEVISANYDATIGKYNWITPDIYSEQCLIRILNSADSSELDRSLNVFTVTNEAKVGDETEHTLTINPNPAIDIISIKFSDYPNAIRIYDIAGNQVRSISGPFADDSIMLDISELNNGIYLLFFENGNKTHIERIVKTGR